MIQIEKHETCEFSLQCDCTIEAYRNEAYENAMIIAKLLAEIEELKNELMIAKLRVIHRT